jgi:hypothetical protein
MPSSAVLDANVLYPFSLRDTLLRLAELKLYTPLWSERLTRETPALLAHANSALEPSRTSPRSASKMHLTINPKVEDSNPSRPIREDPLAPYGSRGSAPLRRLASHGWARRAISADEIAAGKRLRRRPAQRSKDLSPRRPML